MLMFYKTIKVTHRVHVSTTQSGQNVAVETWAPHSLSAVGTAAKRKICSGSYLFTTGENKTTTTKKINSQNVKRNELKPNAKQRKFRRQTKGKLKTHTIKIFE